MPIRYFDRNPNSGAKSERLLALAFALCAKAVERSLESPTPLVTRRAPAGDEGARRHDPDGILVLLESFAMKVTGVSLDAPIVVTGVDE